MTNRRVTKVELLDMAKATVADRGAHYGAPSENFERIAARWRAHIKNTFGIDVPLKAVNVAIMQADIKLARLEHEPAHLDSWVDLAGYSACGADIATETKCAHDGPDLSGLTATEGTPGAADLSKRLAERDAERWRWFLEPKPITTVELMSAANALNAKIDKRDGGAPPLMKAGLSGKWTEGAPLDF